jgi:hypothetical protein
MTNDGNFLIEVDGVAVCQASEIDLPDTEHAEVEIWDGINQNPALVRGKFKVGDITIKQAHALNNEGEEFTRMFQDFIRGVNLERPTIRIVTIGEDGFTPVATDEYIRCIPKKFKPEKKDGKGPNGSYFSITFRAEDHLQVY